jgi:hypothetical protein
LERNLSDANQLGINVVVYTCDVIPSDQMNNSSLLKEASFILDEDRKKLLQDWCRDLMTDGVVGACLEADKILPRLLFVKGKMRLLIMRPYLEEESFLGLMRFVIKQFLLEILGLRKTVIVSRLSIPYSRQRSRNFRWLRDEYNTEQFQDQSSLTSIPKEMLDIPGDSKVVTLCGFLHARKNPSAAYKIIEELRGMREKKVYLVLAGIQDDEFKSEISSFGHVKDVIQIDRLLPENEFKGLLLSSHLVFLPYKNRGASGIVLNSLVLGTPVVLNGSYNWTRLQNYLEGRLFVVRRNHDKQLNEINGLLDLPKKSALPVLLGEKIPTISDFLFHDLT